MADVRDENRKINKFKREKNAATLLVWLSTALTGGRRSEILDAGDELDLGIRQARVIGVYRRQG